MAIFSKKIDEGKKDDAQAHKPAAQASANAVKVPVILVQPRISEKAGHLVSLNKYVFKVQNKANKVEIKKAVEHAYKVKVLRTNIINNQGKTKNSGRITGRTSKFKKAIVTLKKGDKIEGMTETI